MGKFARALRSAKYIRSTKTNCFGVKTSKQKSGLFFCYVGRFGYTNGNVWVKLWTLHANLVPLMLMVCVCMYERLIGSDQKGEHTHAKARFVSLICLSRTPLTRSLLATVCIRKLLCCCVVEWYIWTKFDMYIPLVTRLPQCYLLLLHINKVFLFVIFCLFTERIVFIGSCCMTRLLCNLFFLCC